MIGLAKLFRKKPDQIDSSELMFQKQFSFYFKTRKEN